MRSFLLQFAGTHCSGEGQDITENLNFSQLPQPMVEKTQERDV